VTGSLLETVHGLLRRTYALEAPLESIGRYVIGDAGLLRFYRDAVEEIASEDGEGARLLVREAGDIVRASIYYPDAMIRRLEQQPPDRGLNDGNVDAFAVLVEELDHLLVTAERAHARRSVSRLELELHANVSKYLVLARFLTGRARRLVAGKRLWLRHHLFHKREFSAPDPAVRTRYAEAARFALGFLDRLELAPPAARLPLLRRFDRAPLAI
jgi:hypothetical protein